MINKQIRKWGLLVLTLYVVTNLLLIVFRYVIRYIYGLEPLFVVALVCFGTTFTIFGIIRLILEEKEVFKSASKQ